MTISHDDLCALSRCWNASHAQPHGADYRVNQWLKQQIAAANGNIAVSDEAAIRADEREKCAAQIIFPASGLELQKFICNGRPCTDARGNDLFIGKSDVERIISDIAAAIRKSGGAV